MRDRLIKFRGGRSQEEIARYYGVSQQAWSNWENGHDTPRPATMLQIAKDAGMSIESLFFDDHKYSLLDDQAPTGTEG